MSISCNPKGTASHPDPALTNAIRNRDGLVAVEFYIRHPSQAFSQLFNTLSNGVDGRGIDRVYVNLKRVLVRFIEDGDIRDGRDLHRVAVVVLQTLARHHEILTWHRDHPLLHQPKGENDDQLPLFTDQVDVAEIAQTTTSPAEEFLGKELLARILPEAREIGLLHVRAAQIYRRYEFESGKTHGAYIHLARLAILDQHGQVVKFRSWRTTPNCGCRPDPRVVRQVRRIHLQALERIRQAAQRLGFPIPTGV